MKRPLCHLAILLTAVVYLYLEFFSSAFYFDVPAEQNNALVSVTGKVWSKTFKTGFDGKLMPVLHIIPLKKSKSSFELVECYLKEEDRYLPSIGEYVEIEGKLKVFEPPTNPGEFDSRLYYSTLKISYRLTGARVLAKGGEKNPYREMLFEIRMLLEEALDKTLGPFDAAVMKAMLLGDKAYMDDEIKDMYKSSGIMHILAVSGLHISIIGMGLYRLLKRISDKLYDAFEALTMGRLNKAGQRAPSVLIIIDRSFPVAASIAFMYSYGVMCGMGTSSFRAIMMFALRLLAPVLGRTYDILSALALSEILLILDQPLYLLSSGFLFSFGAVVGIAVINPCLKFIDSCFSSEKRESIQNDERDGRMTFADDREMLIVTLARRLLDGIRSGISIAIATLPVYSSFYYVYPVHSIFLNLFVVPVMGILMVLGIAAMLLGSIALYFGMFLQTNLLAIAAGAVLLLGRVTGAFVHLILAFYKWLCSFTGVTRHLTWYMGHSGKWQTVLYVLLVAAFVFISNRSVLENTFKRICGSAVLKSPYEKDIFRVLLLLAAVFVLTFHVRPDLEINMIDVGQGDGIVISCKNKSILVDGGSTSKKNVGRYRIIPFLKYKGTGELEAIVVTHEDEDHISGILEIFDDMEKGGIYVKSLILPEIDPSSRGENYSLLEKRAGELGISVSYIDSGESFTLGKARFLCLNPKRNESFEGANEYSTVLYMEYGGNTGKGKSFTALFTGDVEGEGQEHLREELRSMEKLEKSKVSLLKVSHHGSKYTTDDEFLRLISPMSAVISCGRDNSYGHPHEEVLERLHDAGAAVYRTDRDGCISICVNGERSLFYHFFISKFIQFGS